MATASLQKFLRSLTRGMMAESLACQSDQQLVERFLAERNEAVFEAIVRRHGPMVYRVCFRILQQSQDAEDAFQATFLVLAQKLRNVRKRTSLASWLHGVAHRVALKAKSQAAVRRRHERQAARSTTIPPDEPSWEKVNAVLDAELSRLPEKWRQPLVLCYLEGQTQEEAAGQLGWSKNTLRRRLEEAREALGRRLQRRGVWPAALSALLLSDCATTAAPATGLLAATADAAVWFAAGQPAEAAISTKVIALSQGVAAISLMKSKWAVVLILVLGLAGGVGMATHNSPAEPAQCLTAEEQVAGNGIDPEKQIPDRKVDFLAGNWSMALPAGFRYEVNLRRLAPDRYALEKAVRFSGEYERRRDRLVMVKPTDRDEGGFEWVIDEDCLILVKQRPVEKLGSDYRGATLKRPVNAGSPSRQPAAAAENWNPAQIEDGFTLKGHVCSVPKTDPIYPLLAAHQAAIEKRHEQSQCTLPVFGDWQRVVSPAAAKLFPKLQFARISFDLRRHPEAKGPVSLAGGLKVAVAIDTAVKRIVRELPCWGNYKAYGKLLVDRRILLRDAAEAKLVWYAFCDINIDSITRPFKNGIGFRMASRDLSK